MDAVINSTLISPIGKIDTTPIPYLNIFVILSPLIPFTRSSTTVTTVSITVSTLTAEIESIYYPPPD